MQGAVLLPIFIDLQTKHIKAISELTGLDTRLYGEAERALYYRIQNEWKSRWPCKRSIWILTVSGVSALTELIW